MKVPLPHPLLVAAEYVLDRDLHNVICNGSLDIAELERIVADVKRWSVRFDRPMLRFHANTRLNSQMEEWRSNVGDLDIMKGVRGLLAQLKELDVETDLWKAQNVYFLIGRKVLPEMKERAAGDDRWFDLFRDLGRDLRVRTE
jgi:hypothetical protein